MRKAHQKIDVAFYLGRRVGISDAINAFYEQNGMTHENFNAAASMRKEYERALSLEATAKQRLQRKVSNMQRAFDEQAKIMEDYEKR